METEKIRNLNDEELARQEKQSAEQLFRLRFQMKLGQNEGVKKLRDLRKDIARIKTIARERALGLHGAALQPASRGNRQASQGRQNQEGQAGRKRGSLSHGGCHSS